MRIVRRRQLATTCALTACAVALLAILPVLANARTSTQYRFEGRGWGHGIGMSQYGANGYAERGWTSEQIIRHYYQGTVLAQRPANGPQTVRVALQSHLSPARLQMVSAGTVTQGAVSMPLAPGDIVSMAESAGRIVVTRARAGEAAVTLKDGGAATPRVTPAVDGGIRILFKAHHAQAGTRFRGTMTAHVFAGNVSIANTVAFEDYLRGVVPDEMPPSWHPEALEAQAIAARAYALNGIRDGGWYDLLSDTRSQVYGGLDAEEESTDRAIADTIGLVPRVGGPDGEVAQTFFFSTSGGRTADNEDVWAGTPRSYLRSVPSPFEHSSARFFWKGAEIERYTPAKLGTELGVPGVRSAAATLHPSGYVDDVVLRTANGTRTLSGSTVQARLGLNSTFFRVQPLSLTAPDTAREGAFVKLSGQLPPSGTTTLTVRRGANVRTVTLTPNGPNRTWVVRTRMTGNLLATMTRSGITGPRLFVRSVPAPA